MARGRLGVGFIGSGFITRFHIKSWVAVRDADVRGVWSPHAGHAEEAAALAGLYDRQMERFKTDPANTLAVAGTPQPELAALTIVCSTLLTCDAALTNR